MQLNIGNSLIHRHHYTLNIYVVPQNIDVHGEILNSAQTKIFIHACGFLGDFAIWWLVRSLFLLLEM